MDIEGVVFYPVIIVSKESARGRGLLTQAFQFVTQRAKDNNFKHMVGISINYKLRHMMEKHIGMRKVVELDLKQFQYDGIRPFKEIDDANQLGSLYWKDL